MKLKPPSDWKDSTKICLFRMWVAGAVCFFGAWGRAGGINADSAYSLDLIAGLLALLILSDLLIVRPVVKHMFKIKNADTGKRSILFVIGISFLRFIKTTVILVSIVMTYYLINTLIIQVFHFDGNSVPLPLEPFLFGIFYGIYFTLYSFLENRIKLLFVPKRSVQNELL